MRILLIIVLSIACLWLLSERSHLTERVIGHAAQTAGSKEQVVALTKEVAALKSSLFAAERQNQELQEKLAAALNRPMPGSPPKPNWLDSHLERGARALEPPSR